MWKETLNSSANYWDNVETVYGVKYKYQRKSKELTFNIKILMNPNFKKEYLVKFLFICALDRNKVGSDWLICFCYNFHLKNTEINLKTNQTSIEAKI